MHATDIIDGSTDLKSMGLEKPLEVISIVLMDNKKYTIKIGKNAGDNSFYAMVAGSPAVYVINRSMLAPFGKPLRDMVDTRLLTEDRTAITSINITGEGKTVLLTRRLHNQWYKNGAAFTRVSSVNGLLDALTSLRAERFIYNTAVLKHPAYTFTVTGTMQPTTTTISIGSIGKETVYAGTSLDPRPSVLNTGEAGTLEKDIKEIYQ